MGRYWGVFWHQLHTRKLSSLSSFLVNSVLRITRRAMVGTVLFLFTTFLSSRVAHFIIDLAVGIGSSESGVVWFFLLQAVAICF